MTWAVKIIEQNKAWKTPIRFVLLIMANRADEEGVLYPSVRWIKDRTALGESTIREATHELQQLGLLIKEPRLREQGGQTSNEYRLAMSQFVLRLAPPGPLDGGGAVQRGGGAVQHLEGGGPAPGPHETKDKKKEKRKDIPMPDGFGISPAVMDWARRKGFEQFVGQHLEYLVDWAKQNPGDWCADWDARLRNSVRADWGGVRRQAMAAARRGERVDLDAPQWWQTDAGIKKWGAEHGIRSEPGELFSRFTARVFVAAGDGPWISKAGHVVRSHIEDLMRARAEAT